MKFCKFVASVLVLSSSLVAGPVFAETPLPQAQLTFVTNLALPPDAVSAQLTPPFYTGFNERGDLVASYARAGGTMGWLLYSGGILTPIGITDFNVNRTVYFDINNNGVAVGYSGTHGMMRSGSLNICSV